MPALGGPGRARLLVPEAPRSGAARVAAPWHPQPAASARRSRNDEPSSYPPCSKIVRERVAARSASPSRTANASAVARLATAIVRPCPLASIGSVGTPSRMLGSGGPGRSLLILRLPPPPLTSFAESSRPLPGTRRSRSARPRGRCRSLRESTPADSAIIQLLTLQIGRRCHHYGSNAAGRTGRGPYARVRW